jgi:tRNA dimethylallyltransferase
MPAQKRVVFIAGPTASGKSALALDIARERGGVIINADSMQVYRELRILTARPTPEDEAAIPHRLYGWVAGAEPWSVARWLEAARCEIETAWAGGLLPVLAGGTGLYFKALEQGLADIPPIPAAVREKWRKAAGDLHGELQRRDPQSAMRLEPGDRQRIIRALEVVEATGKPLSFWHKAAKSDAALTGAEIDRRLVIPDRRELHARAEARFEKMVEQGAIEEVRSLLRQNLPPSQPVMKAIGVRELADYIHGKSTLDEAGTRAKAATRQYIKRQLTWWRHQTIGWSNIAA